MNRIIRIAIVEDNTQLLSALLHKLENRADFKIVLTALNGKECIEKMAQYPSELLPEVILMDIEMPEMNGIEATHFIKNKYPDIKIMMLTVFDHDQHVFGAIQAGAEGYLLKIEKADKIIESIYQILAGDAPMTTTIALKTLQFIRSNYSNPKTEPKLNLPEENQLTKREIQILEAIAEGLTYKEIADKMFIAFDTVKTHIRNIYTKLKINNKVQASQIIERLKKGE